MRVRDVVRIGLAVGLLAGAGALVAPAPAGAVASTGFVAVTPARMVDTRIGQGAPLGRVLPGGELAVTAPGGVPGGATRLAVRITGSDSIGQGELSVHACGAYDPAGLVHLELGRDADTTLVFVALQAGRFCLTVTAPTHVTIDLEGYEDSTGGAAFAAVDRRVIAESVPIAAGGTIAVTAATIGVPAGATAVSVALVATSETAGFVTLYPCDEPRPLAATLIQPGGDRLWLTAAVGRLSASGDLCAFANAATTVRIVLYGYWAVGATATAIGPFQYASRPSPPPGFVAVEPARLFDTRSAGGPVGGGQVKVLDLSSTVPAGATDVVMNVTVTDPVAGGFVTVYPCEVDRPVVSNLNFSAGQTVPNLVTVSVGSDARVCFYGNVATNLVADLAGWYESGGGDGYVPVTPSRLFDTRSGPRLGAGATYTLDLSGTVGADASAVVMNVTVTETGGPGFVTVYPCASARPTASNLNYVAGQTVPNLVTVAVGPDRKVCFYTSGAAHLLADVGGWYAPSSSVGYVGLVPERLFDTRTGTALAAGDAIAEPYGPGDAPGAVADAVVALVLNVTAVEPEGPGFVTVYPCANGRPTVSNVNYVRGDVVPNLSIVRTDVNDEVCFYTLAGTHLLADVAGYFSSLPVLEPVDVR